MTTKVVCLNIHACNTSYGFGAKVFSIAEKKLSSDELDAIIKEIDDLLRANTSGELHRQINGVASEQTALSFIKPVLEKHGLSVIEVPTIEICYDGWKREPYVHQWAPEPV